jgi:hypothetical protein
MSTLAFPNTIVTASIRPLLALFLIWGSLSVRAGVEEDAQKAALLLALPLEEAGFDFRADIWVRELTSEVGKAVRVQMFKGNDYRVCVSVPTGSGAQITAHVLDGEGANMEAKAEPTPDGAGTVLHVKPPRTGVYLFVVKLSGGKTKKTICAMITGYK